MRGASVEPFPTGTAAFEKRNVSYTIAVWDLVRNARGSRVRLSSVWPRTANFSATVRSRMRICARSGCVS